MAVKIKAKSFDQFENNKKINQRSERYAFIGEGKHRFAIEELTVFDVRKKGRCVKATLRTLKSTSKTHPEGSRCTKLWFVDEEPNYPDSPSHADYFADFLRQCKGAPDDYQVGPDVKKLLIDRHDEQLLKGVVVDCLGVNTAKDPEKRWIETYWTHVKQTREQVAEMRAKLEAEEPNRDRPAPEPQQAAKPATEADEDQETEPAKPKSKFLKQLDEDDANSPW